jgi:hypothetical protein
MAKAQDIQFFLTDVLHHPNDTVQIIISYLSNVVETLNTIIYQTKHRSHKKKNENEEFASQVFNCNEETLVYVFSKDDEQRVNCLHETKLVRSFPMVKFGKFALVINHLTGAVENYFGYEQYGGTCYTLGTDPYYTTETESKYAKRLNNRKLFSNMYFYGNYFLRCDNGFKIVDMQTNRFIKLPYMMSHNLLGIHKNVLFFCMWQELIMYRFVTESDPPQVIYFKTIDCEEGTIVQDVCVVEDDMYVLLTGRPSFVNVYSFKSHKLKRTITFPKKVRLNTTSDHQLCANGKHVYILYANGLIILNRTRSADKKKVINLTFKPFANHRNRKQ